LIPSQPYKRTATQVVSRLQSQITVGCYVVNCQYQVATQADLTCRDNN